MRPSCRDGIAFDLVELDVKSGPSAGKTKVVFDFHVGLDDELVSVWETAVIRSAFSRELSARAKPDFEPGERITITPAGEKEGQNGTYRDFEIAYEYAAPKLTAAQLLDPSRAEETPFDGEAGDDDIAF